jgi:hypothetical protein
MLYNGVFRHMTDEVSGKFIVLYGGEFNYLYISLTIIRVVNSGG